MGLKRWEKYRRFCSQYQAEHGHEPQDGEAAAHLGVSLERVWEAKRNAHISKLVSLDSLVAGTDGSEDATVGDFAPDGENLEEAALESIWQGHLREVLWGCVDGLESGQRRYSGRGTRAA